MKCFVIMPFGNPTVSGETVKRLNHLYDEEIKPTVESVRVGKGGGVVRCERADKDPRSGEIIIHILEKLFAADLVVADLSGRNANVFYELGVRHALGKRTILIADNVNDIPFDLRGLRTIPYRFDYRGLGTFRRKLKEAVKAALVDVDGQDNPVSRFLLDREIERIKAKETPATFDVMQELLGEVRSLKDTIKNQGEEMKSLAAGITSRPGKGQSKIKSPERVLSSLQGLWQATPSNSLACVRMVGGKLYAPYCYGGGYSLTAHYFNFQLIGSTVFVRFKWFDADISGYGMYKIVSRNKLAGGWWYDEEVPESVRRGIEPPDGSSAAMHPLVMTRLKGKRKFPKWAEDYFQRLKG